MDAAGIKREKWQNGLHMFRHTVVSEISNFGRFEDSSGASTTLN